MRQTLDSVDELLTSSGSTNLGIVQIVDSKIGSIVSLRQNSSLTDLLGFNRKVSNQATGGDYSGDSRKHVVFKMIVCRSSNSVGKTW